MNVGVEAAHGEYIALLDHDDVMLSDKLAASSGCSIRILAWSLC